MRAGSIPFLDGLSHGTKDIFFGSWSHTHTLLRSHFLGHVMSGLGSVVDVFYRETSIVVAGSTVLVSAETLEGVVWTETFATALGTVVVAVNTTNFFPHSIRNELTSF